jgi:hypothetical protein
MRGDITVQFVPSGAQRADIMTKPLAGACFQQASYRAGLRLMSRAEFMDLEFGDAWPVEIVLTKVTPGRS